MDRGAHQSKKSGGGLQRRACCDEVSGSKDEVDDEAGNSFRNGWFWFPIKGAMQL